MRSRAQGAVLASVLAFGGLGLTSGPVHSHAASLADSSVARAALVHMTGTSGGHYAFSPGKLTVKVGTRVTWRNSSPVPHTVTGDSGWNYTSRVVLPQHGVSIVFKKAGTYHYICSIHPSMHGTITVKK